MTVCILVPELNVPPVEDLCQPFRNRRRRLISIAVALLESQRILAMSLHRAS